ncbi:ras association domain-containing protein 2 [Macrosteles quadrilineatus]|uniref:ras association domain-containing protein 2 n=1 Tax=Macrosteles quadrilineatus TaxID=74068 RepID=UPI0023E09C7E|nr:ras association domain-containing protein 2 [Macrosteles quadrilineatus]
MWKCHKCGKPVYFAERKQSLGYDWHPECLRCEECGKRLNPGQHAEHKGVPYCHVPCYGALFGPQLFGHGTRVESHTSFGKVENKSAAPNMPRSHLESKLKIFNQFYDGKSSEIRSREVNGRLVLEGALRIHWGVIGVIHLKEDDDQRTVVTIRKRNSCRSSVFNVKTDEVSVDVKHIDSTDSESGVVVNEDGASEELTNGAATSVEQTNGVATSVEQTNGVATSVEQQQQTNGVFSSEVDGGVSRPSLTLPSKLDLKTIDWDELDELLQVERKVDDGQKLYQTMPASVLTTLSCTPPPSPSDQDEYSQTFEDTVEEERAAGVNRSESVPESFELSSEEDEAVGNSEGSVVRRRVGSTAIKRRAGHRRSRNAKLRRRCSINGHFYNRETSFFTPPFGSQMSVWVTSLVSTQEVINLMLDKYKVDSNPANFALFVVRDNGEQRRLQDDEYPLLVRVMLGPHEDVSKLYLMDRHNTDEISNEVAQFLNLTSTELRAILERYSYEEEREVRRIKAKYKEMRKRMKQRMEQLKVRL